MTCLQERFEVLRIHASSVEESVDVGLARRLQRGEHLRLEAPFGRVVELCSELRLGHGRSPPPEERQNPHFLVVHPHFNAVRDCRSVVLCCLEVSARSGDLRVEADSHGWGSLTIGRNG